MKYELEGSEPSPTPVKITLRQMRNGEVHVLANGYTIMALLESGEVYRLAHFDEGKRLQAMGFQTEKATGLLSGVVVKEFFHGR